MASMAYELQDYPDLAQALGTSFDQTVADGLLILRGDCPRCAHPFTAELAIQTTLVVPGRGLTGMTSDDLAKGPREHVLSCSCSHDHPGRPTAESGCGAMAKIVVQAKS